MRRLPCRWRLIRALPGPFATGGNACGGTHAAEVLAAAQGVK
jgi:hypothetical protein